MPPKETGSCTIKYSAAGARSLIEFRRDASCFSHKFSLPSFGLSLCCFAFSARRGRVRVLRKRRLRCRSFCSSLLSSHLALRLDPTRFPSSLEGSDVFSLRRGSRLARPMKGARSIPRRGRACGFRRRTIVHHGARVVIGCSSDAFSAVNFRKRRNRLPGRAHGRQRSGRQSKNAPGRSNDSRTNAALAAAPHPLPNEVEHLMLIHSP